MSVHMPFFTHTPLFFPFIFHPSPLAVYASPTLQCHWEAGRPAGASLGAVSLPLPQVSCTACPPIWPFFANFFHTRPRAVCTPSALQPRRGTDGSASVGWALCIRLQASSLTHQFTMIEVEGINHPPATHHVPCHLYLILFCLTFLPLVASLSCLLSPSHPLYTS
jgi:hypothetical protein